MLHWVSTWIYTPADQAAIQDYPTDDSLVAQDVDEDWILFGEHPAVATQIARKISRQERRFAQRKATKKSHSALASHTRTNHDASQDLLFKLKDRELKERKLRKLSLRSQASGGGVFRGSQAGTMGIMRPGGGAVGVIA